MNSLISVIIPIYNKETYLKKCINSVINQTYKTLEIILINDGSSDNSLLICEDFLKKDERITIINQNNQGVSKARNNGLNKAKGEWVCFLDADDYLDSSCFEDLIKYSLNDNIDVIQFGLRKWQGNNYLGERRNNNYLICHTFEELLNSLTLTPVSACLHLVKKSLLDTNKIIFDEDMSYGEDMLFMYKVFMCAKSIVLTDKVLYNQVLSDNSLTRSSVSYKQLKNNLDFSNRLIEYAKEKEQLTVFNKELNSMLKTYFINLINYSGYWKERRKLQKDFRNHYKTNKDVLKSKYIQLAAIDLNIIVIPTYFKFKLLS